MHAIFSTKPVFRGLLWLLSCLIGSAYVAAAPFVPERNAQCVAVSLDGRFVATGKSGMSNSEFPPRPHPTIRKCGLIQIWDARTGRMLHRLQSFGDFTRLQFSPDGKRLASCRLFTPGEGLEMSEVRVWDVVTGKPLKVLNRCHAFAFHPQGREFAVLSRSKCVVYDTRSFRKLRRIDELGRALSVEYASDGSKLLGVKQMAGKFHILSCDAISGSLLCESQGLEKPFYRVAACPSRPLVASGHESGAVVLWDVEALTPLRQLKSYDRGLAHPFFSPDGTMLAVGSQRNGDVEFWDLASGKRAHRYTFQRGTLRTYHPRSPKDQICPERDPSRFAFMPNGDAFVAGCFGGMIRTVSSGQELRRFGY